MENSAKIGIIGGSGFYNIGGSESIEEVSIDTPWGSPSDKYSLFNYEGIEIAFLPRHGKGHNLLPSEINYRANIYGMKMLGVERIISVSAVGSYKQEIAPRDIVIVDQYYDRTRGTDNNSYFGDGIAGHISFGEPVCPVLSEVLYNSLSKQESKVHQGGTYVNMEGPAFSTKAESQFFKKMGMDVVGMTNLKEARLAREAEICFSSIALVTDYDSWHEEIEAVSVSKVMENLSASIESAKEGILSALSEIPKDRNCACVNSLSDAIITDKSNISRESHKKISLLVDKYLN